MSATEHKAIVTEWVERVWNRGEEAYIDATLAPGYVLHVDGAGDFLGATGFRQVRDMYRAAFPDIHITIDDLVAEGDRCVWRFHASGTHRGELMGIPPSGNPIAISGMIVSRFADGRWAEDWGGWDMYSMLQQIGAIPAPAAVA